MNEIKKYLKKNLTCSPIKSEKISLSTRPNEKRMKIFDFVIRTINKDIVAVGQFIPKTNFENRLKELDGIASKDFPYPLFLFGESKGEGENNWNLNSYDNINAFKKIIEPILYYNVDTLIMDLKRLSRELNKQEDLLLELCEIEDVKERCFKKLQSLEIEIKQLKQENLVLARSNNEKSNVIYNNKEEIEKLKNKILKFEQEVEERIRIEFRNCSFTDDLVKNSKNIYFPNEGEPGYMGFVNSQGKDEYISYYNGEWYFQKCTFNFDNEQGGYRQGWSYFYKYNYADQTFEKIDLTSGLNIQKWIDFKEIGK
jgi:hypothetical protein